MGCTRTEATDEYTQGDTAIVFPEKRFDKRTGLQRLIDTGQVKHLSHAPQSLAVVPSTGQLVIRHARKTVTLHLAGTYRLFCGIRNFGIVPKGTE